MKLENPNIGPNDWWRTLKNTIKPEQSTGFPPILHDDAIYSTEKEKAEILNKHFTKQTVFNETNANLPPNMPNSPYHIDRVSILPTEVESTLRALKTG